jgi:hypothetical protein
MKLPSPENQIEIQSCGFLPGDIDILSLHLHHRQPKATLVWHPLKKKLELFCKSHVFNVNPKGHSEEHGWRNENHQGKHYKKYLPSERAQCLEFELHTSKKKKV